MVWNWMSWAHISLWNQKVVGIFTHSVLVPIYAQHCWSLLPAPGSHGRLVCILEFNVNLLYSTFVCGLLSVSIIISTSVYIVLCIRSSSLFCCSVVFHCMDRPWVVYLFTVHGHLSFSVWLLQTKLWWTFVPI